MFSFLKSSSQHPTSSSSSYGFENQAMMTLTLQERTIASALGNLFRLNQKLF